MTAEELALLRAVGAPRQRVLEFGAGGSTGEWVALGCPHIVSVEADARWIDRLSMQPDLREPIRSGRLTLFHVDIGPVRRWSFPDGEQHVHLWPDYWASVWESDLIRHAPQGPDLVYVDGRFRIACALTAAARVAPPGLIAFHDFWSRPRYHVLFDHLTVVASQGELVVLQRRPDFDAERAAATVAEHALDFR